MRIASLQRIGDRFLQRQRLPRSPGRRESFVAKLRVRGVQHSLVGRADCGRRPATQGDA
jgi:hypothetical protein